MGYIALLPKDITKNGDPVGEILEGKNTRNRIWGDATTIHGQLR
jgi:hypothetical protein